MLKKKTAVARRNFNLIGGEWAVAENNARGSIINMVPEFPMNEPYRGNFQAIQIHNNILNVLNTAHCEEDNDEAGSTSGELQLRWLKITRIPGEEDKYTALPREKTVTVPHLPDCQAKFNGWLYLKMSRVENLPGDISFYDEVLGQVDLRFNLVYSAALPNDSRTACILPLAAVVIDKQGSIEEIIQQQFGPGVLWVPHDVQDEISSSSSSDPESSSSIEPIDPPDDPIDPPESSSSEPIDPPDDPIDPPESSSSDPESSSLIDPPESSSSDPDDSDDSSSSTVNDGVIIDVTWQYDSVTRGDFVGMGMETHTYHLYLTGSFTVPATYPAAGYIVRMTGSAVNDYGDGSPLTENICWDLNIFRNEELGRWDVFHGKLSDWAAYYQEQDSELDIDFSTPLYSFPDLQTAPSYPVGSILVDHHLIHGVSNNIPDNDQTTSLRITFTVR